MSDPALPRRLTLDLTGLPPTSREVDAYLADDRPDKRSRFVRALLEDFLGKQAASTAKQRAS